MKIPAIKILNHQREISSILITFK